MSPMLSQPNAWLRSMLVWLAWFVVLTAGSGCSQSVERDESAPLPEFGLGGAVVVRIEGQLSVESLALVSRAMTEAKRDERDVLVIDLDTPGGKIETMWKLAKLIRSVSEDEGVRTVTWVHDHALSAGVLVTLATTSTYVTSRSTIGAATPVILGPTGITELPEAGGVRAKMMSAMRADSRAWAEKANRPGSLAEAMIDSELRVVQVRIDGELRYLTSVEWSNLREQGTTGQLERTISAQGELLTLTGPEAVEMGFVDGIAESLAIVLEKSGAGDREPLMLVSKSSEQLLGWLDLMTPLLIGLGIALAFIELKMPGFGLPGTLAVVCLATAFAGSYFVGLADVPHLVLVTIGFALIAVELFLMPGTVWFGLGGGVLVIGGLFWSQLGPGFDLESALDRQFAFDAVFQLLVTTAVALIAAMVFARLMPNIPGANRLLVTPREDVAFGEGLPEMNAARSRARVGVRGEVLTALRPVGKVVLGGDRSMVFEARSLGSVLESGAQIVVTEVSGDRLVVEPVEQEEA